MSTYSDVFAPLAHIYLEDSWVLALRQSDTTLAFDLDVVLTEGHPEYTGPAAGEQYDYRRARLTLQGAVTCTLSGRPPATDATGEQDLGNIDSWLIDDAGTSLLAGDWGEAQVANAEVEFALV